MELTLHGKAYRTRMKLRKFLKALSIQLVFLIWMPQVSEASLSCEKVFTLISFESAQELLFKNLKQIDFPQISIMSIRKMENFGPDHPDRSHGFQSKEILRGTLNKKRVLIKKSNLFEIRMASALSELGIGPKFWGTTLNGEYYVIDFVEGSLLIKTKHYDRRASQMIKEGFKIKRESLTKIDEILESLALLSLEPRDPQFLIQPNGEVFLIDPEFFAITNFESASQYSKELKKQFANQFHLLEQLQKPINF